MGTTDGLLVVETEQSLGEQGSNAEATGEPHQVVLSLSNECATTCSSTASSTVDMSDDKIGKDDSLPSEHSNIPRRSKSSELDQPAVPHSTCSQSSSTNTCGNLSDMPTAANSRSFFQHRENQKSTVPNLKIESAVPGPPEPSPSTLFSVQQLAHAVRIAIEAPTVSKVDLFRLPSDSQMVISDVKASDNSIFATVHNKLDGILKLLRAPARVDWKPSRRAAAEQHPISLLDALVDTIGLCTATLGVWSLDDDERVILVGQMDDIAVLVSDLQRRLFYQNKARAKSASPPNSPSTKAPLANGFGDLVITQSSLIEALGRLTSCLSEALRCNLELSSSQLFHPISPDPLVAAVTGVYTEGTKSNFASPKVSCQRGPKQARQSLASFVSTLGDFQSRDHVAPFVKTVQTLVSSDLCCRLFESPELRDSLECLQGIRAALEELARQRTFEWTSNTAQGSLPHHSYEMPIESLTLEPKKKLKQKNRRDSEIGGRRGPNIKNSIGCREVQVLLGNRLLELSNAFRTLYRFVGSILGGHYEDPSIHAELTDASVLGSYVSMVGFLFHHDLVALAQWMAPVMSQVRRKIKQQTAAVNAIPPSTPRSLNESSQSEQVAPSQTQPCTTHASAAHLSSLLASPQDICLTRLSESEAVHYFFLPYLRKARAEGSQIGAPADRVNRILVWLAWEGGLTSLYESMLQHTTEDIKPSLAVSSPKNTKRPLSPSASSSNVSHAAMEDAIVCAIMEGCRIVKEKLTNGLHLFQLNNPHEWTGRGEDVLEFCQRVIEAVSLRYTGEVDLRNSKDVHSKLITPKWKQCLLVNLGRATLPTKQSQVSTRVLEALPKLFGEYCHQSLFYSCPLQRLGLQETATSTSASIATNSAATARLSGVSRDLDLRITHTQHLAEAGILNSHQNFDSINELSEQLKDLSSQFQSQTHGIIERHSNQIRNHTNRLEEHTTDIRRVQQLVTSHQARLESHTAEIKKFIDVATELKAEALESQKNVEASAKQCSTDFEARVTAALQNLNSTVGHLVQSSISCHIEAIKELKLTAISLTDQTKEHQTQTETLLNTVAKLDEKVHNMESKLKHLYEIDGRLQTLEAQNVEQHQQLEHNNQMIRETTANAQDNMDKMMKGFLESIIHKSKGELSSYLTECLSHCVNNHVTYHLDRVLQNKQHSSSRKKLLTWASSSASQTKTAASVHQNATVTVPPTHTESPSTSKGRITVPSVALKSRQPPSLIQSTHRTPNRASMNDDLTSLADSSSVMEESCPVDTPLLGHSVSWFTDVPLLDLPDPRSSGSFASDDRYLTIGGRPSCPISGLPRCNLAEAGTPMASSTSTDGRYEKVVQEGLPSLDLGGHIYEVGQEYSCRKTSDENRLDNTPQLQTKYQNQEGDSKKSGKWNLVRCGSGNPPVS